MSVSVYQLFNEKHNPYRLKLLGGEKGLSRDVSWVQVMEDEEYASFLMKNELIFTTGVGKSGEADWLMSMIMTLIKHDASGLVINVGKYLTPDDITDDIRALCDTYQFPLFIMPWCIRLADVLQAFLYDIFLTKQKEVELISACRQLFFMQNKEDSIKRLALHGFGEHQPYQAAVFCSESPCRETEQDMFLSAYKFVLNQQMMPYILFAINQHIVLLLQVREKDEAASLIDRLCHCVNQRRSMRHNVGVGMTVPSLRQVSASYDQALYAAAWACSHDVSVQYFINLGIYAVLFAQRDRMVIQELHDRYLGKLLQYDAAHDSHLFQTLESYLRHGGSIRAAAQETYMHRNTVSYRIGKIKNLLGCRLDNEHEKFMYTLACHIHRYLTAAGTGKDGEPDEA